MNKLTIIGNLTRDPEMRTTKSGKEVCSFTVAVNRRKTQNNQDPGADYFLVTAWDGMAKTCGQYLSKGRKVAVIGPVSVHAYQQQNGEAGATLEVTASEVEFLSPKSDIDPQSGYQKVDPDGLPY